MLGYYSAESGMVIHIVDEVGKGNGRVEYKVAIVPVATTGT